MEPPEWYLKVHNQYANEMGAESGDPHTYPDTRPLNKRYRLEQEKYAAWKAPANGMVVRESPYAVTGTYATGGSFTPDLSKLSQPTPQSPPKVQKRPTLRDLLRRFRSKVAAEN
jgi:hypothetical protein